MYKLWRFNVVIRDNPEKTNLNGHLTMALQQNII